MGWMGCMGRGKWWAHAVVGDEFVCSIGMGCSAVGAVPFLITP
jgi:hypothetical protein